MFFTFDAMQILPYDGEIVFGSDVVLAFTNEPDHSADCLSSGSRKYLFLTLDSELYILNPIMHPT